MSLARVGPNLTEKAEELELKTTTTPTQKALELKTTTTPTATPTENTLQELRLEPQVEEEMKMQAEQAHQTHQPQQEMAQQAPPEGALMSRRCHPQKTH